MSESLHAGMMELSFFVAGTPVQQGSKTAWVPKGLERAVMFDQNTKRLKPWRDLVKAAAIAAQGDRPQMTGALEVAVTFWFARPKTVKRETPSVKPDIDKLLRSVFDALTDSKAIKDDALIVIVTAKKKYGNTPGARVHVVPTR